MNYFWDHQKNKTNIEKYGIDFTDALEIFKYPMLTCIDNRSDYGEERWVGIGFLKGIIAVIVYTEDDLNEIIRVISARKATTSESQKFKETIGY